MIYHIEQWKVGGRDLQYYGKYQRKWVVFYGMVWYGMVWYGVVLYGMAWLGMVW